MFICSIIIPHKNCPELLNQCVASIPERDDIQIIVVDDNSDEGKKPVISRPGVEVILLDAENAKGAGRARNMGLEKATGKWILFSDSDDTFETENLNRMLDKYQDSEADIVFFNANRVDEQTGEVLSQHLSKSKYERDAKQYSDFMRYRSNVPWAKMIRRELIENNSIRFSEVPAANDLFFSAVSGYYAKEVLIDFTVIYDWKVRKSGSITSTVSKQSILSKLDQASKKNEFLWEKGLKEWCTNLYTASYWRLRGVGFNHNDALREIDKCITVGPVVRWKMAFWLSQPIDFISRKLH